MKAKILLALLLAVFLIACKHESKKHADLVNKAAKDTTYNTTVQWLDSMFNLGTINSGDKKEVKFRCLNTGSKPLVLLSVSPGCGCTVASYTDGEIMPQKEGWITATFSSKGQCDSVIKEIKVITNTKPDSLKVLTFKAYIVGCKSNDIVVPRHDVEDNK